MDIHRRETPLMMGVGILLVMVAIVFFGVTIAGQQLLQRRAWWQALRSQVGRVERQAQRRQLLPTHEQLMAEASSAAQPFVTEETAPAIRGRLEQLASELGTTITFFPSLAPGPPAQPLPGFEGCYQVIPVVVTVEGRYRNLDSYMARACQWTAPAVALRSCTITSLRAGGGAPWLRARLVFETFLWTPGALPKAPIASPATTPPVPAAAGDRPRLADAAPGLVGHRPSAFEGSGRDPFDPRWMGESAVAGTLLSGILWDPRAPTCIVNGEVVGVGEVVNGYTVIAIMPDAVLLRGPDELVLQMPP